MTAFLLGVLGALSVLALLSTGAIIGWKARTAYTAHLEALRPPAPEPHEMTPEELERFRQDQEAFETMLHYSPEIAYGLQSDPLQEMARKKE